MYYATPQYDGSLKPLECWVPEGFSRPISGPLKTPSPELTNDILVLDTHQGWHSFNRGADRKYYSVKLDSEIARANNITT